MTLLDFPMITATEQPTLADLQAIHAKWLQQGAALFPDMVMVAMSLGEAHKFWGWERDMARVFNDDGYTLLYTKISTVYNPEKRALIFKASILVTVGDWTYSERTTTGMPIIRADVVCKLQRYGCAGHNQPVDLSDTLSLFRPGKWTEALLSHLPYSREMHNSRKEMSEEFERIALSKKLLIGRDV